MSPINYSRYKYSPDEIEEQAFLERFVVRTQEFDDLSKIIRDADYEVPQQHCIIVGQRGQGKTTLLRRLMLAVEKDQALSKFLIPVKFAEEQYQIRSLSRLWEEVADYLQSIHQDTFENILDQMEAHFDDDDYELKCFSYLEKCIKSQGKKLLLLIDNIDELLGKLKAKEQHQLREILISSSSFRIIGGSTRMLEKDYDYGKPFYEYFQILRLQGLSTEECHTFLRVIGQGEQRDRIDHIIKESPQRIEVLRRLTGGVPRTMVMLFDIFLDDDGNAFDDLLKVLDEATPLYKHRMDDLPAALQDITHVIAMNWDGMGTGEIARKTRMKSKEVAAQLKQLENKYGMVVSTSTGKNKIYQLEERFFNIWYLMRFGRKKDRQRVEWLVRFLNSWCTPVELEKKAAKFVEALKQGNVNTHYTMVMCEALGYAGLDADTEYLVKETTRTYLRKEAPELVDNISSSENEVIGKAFHVELEVNAAAAIELLEAQPIKGRLTSICLCILYFEQGQYLDRAVKEIQNIDSKPTVDSLLFALIMLWAEYIDESEKLFRQGLDFFKKIAGLELFISDYLLLLATKGQYHRAKQLMEIEQYQLKSRFPPLWYALMTLMQDEYPIEIKKMGTELQGTVDELLEKIKAWKIKYAINE